MTWPSLALRPSVRTASCSRRRSWSSSRLPPARAAASTCCRAHASRYAIRPSQRACRIRGAACSSIVTRSTCTTIPARRARAIHERPRNAAAIDPVDLGEPSRDRSSFQDEFRLRWSTTHHGARLPPPKLPTAGSTDLLPVTRHRTRTRVTPAPRGGRVRFASPGAPRARSPAIGSARGAPTRRARALPAPRSPAFRRPRAGFDCGTRCTPRGWVPGDRAVPGVTLRAGRDGAQGQGP